MDVTEEKFKLALATDLIIYMIQIWTQNSTEQVKMIDQLMNKWSERIDNSADVMKRQIAQQMAENNENVSEDVAMILLDVNNTENVMMKGEFKSQMREAIYKGLSAHTKMG